MNRFCRIRCMNSVREEMHSRIKSGMNAEQAADEALAAVQAKFVKPGDPKTAIDWATLLPMILELIALLMTLLQPPVPPTP